MTHPTKAIAPILLEDMRRVAVEKKGETNFFTSQMIKDCMKKVGILKDLTGKTVVNTFSAAGGGRQLAPGDPDREGL